MLGALAIALLALWAFGFVGAYMMGGLLHLVAATAVVLILANVAGRVTG